MIAPKLESTWNIEPLKSSLKNHSLYLDLLYHPFIGCTIHFIYVKIVTIEEFVGLMSIFVFVFLSKKFLSLGLFFNDFVMGWNFFFDSISGGEGLCEWLDGHTS